MQRGGSACAVPSSAGWRARLTGLSYNVHSTELSYISPGEMTLESLNGQTHRIPRRVSQVSALMSDEMRPHVLARSSIT